MFLELSHTQTDVFIKSRELMLECYKLTKQFPPEERYALAQQIRRAALSVRLNIAEGCSRKSGMERRRFFEIARGSVIEVDTAIGIAVDLQYISRVQAKCLGECIISTFKQLSALIRNLTHS